MNRTQEMVSPAPTSDERNSTSHPELPRLWKIVPLKNICSVSRASMDPRACQTEEFEYYSIPAYQETGRASISLGREILSLKLVVRGGAILFGKLNPRVPKIWLVPIGGQHRKIASTEFIVLEAKEGVATPEYLYFLCWSQHVLPTSQELVSGSTPSRQRVDVNAFMEIRVPLPPLDEQRAIASALESARRAGDAAARLLAASRQVERTMLFELMAGTIRAPGFKEGDRG